MYIHVYIYIYIYIYIHIYIIYIHPTIIYFESHVVDTESESGFTVQGLTYSSFGKYLNHEFTLDLGECLCGSLYIKPR